MKYLSKFDGIGNHLSSFPLDSTIDETKREELINKGFIEITENDWNYYVGNMGTGTNGTGYIRGKDGKPTDAAAYVPTKEEKLATLDAQYDADKAAIMSYFTAAVFAGDEDEQAELRAEMADIDAAYIEDRKAIENEEE